MKLRTVKLYSLALMTAELVSFTVWRRAKIAFGLVVYRIPCQCPALAWPFVVINRKVCSAELE